MVAQSTLRFLPFSAGVSLPGVAVRGAFLGGADLDATLLDAALLGLPLSGLVRAMAVVVGMYVNLFRVGLQYQHEPRDDRCVSTNWARTRRNSLPMGAKD
jgi:hypothetical protein